MQFDLNGAIQRVWGAGDVGYPFGLAATEELSFIADSEAGRVVGYGLE